MRIYHEPELSLPRQLGLGKDTHIDEIPTPLTIHVALRTGRELRALHTHNSLISEEFNASSLRIQRPPHPLLQPLDEPVAEGISKHGVRDDRGVLEERRRPDSLGAIDNLRGDNERSRRDFLAKRANGREGDYGADAERLESGDVGAAWDIGGVDEMPNPMSGEEGDAGARGKTGDGDRRTRKSPGLFDASGQSLVKYRQLQALTVSGFTDLL